MQLLPNHTLHIVQTTVHQQDAYSACMLQRGCTKIIELGFTRYGQWGKFNYNGIRVNSSVVPWRVCAGQPNLWGPCSNLLDYMFDNYYNKE